MQVCCAGKQRLLHDFMEIMMQTFLGIDVSKKSFDVALYADKKLLSTGAFSNSPAGFKKLSNWLGNQGVQTVWACLESTGRYGNALAQYLFDAGHQVSLVNPLRIKKYAESKLQRNKTDQLDAKVIADFCRTQEPSLWQPVSAEQEALQELSRRLLALKKERTAERNRLKSGYKNQKVKESIKRSLLFLSEEIKALEAEIQSHIDQNPDLQKKAKLLDSIPGIGPKTASLILAELPAIERFQNVGQVIAYAGLSPQRHRSGSSVR
jgi:transposase